MGIIADLHMHSNHSDGDLSPAELMRMARSKGVEAVSLTDHDNMSGLHEAKMQARALGMRFINGVEISTGSDGRTHLLAYGLDMNNPEINNILSKIRAERTERFREMARKTEDLLHVQINTEYIIKNNKGSLGRPHIADELVRLGIVKGRNEAFDRFLNENGPLYVKQNERRTSEIIEIVKKEKGIPVLAHPGLIHKPQENVTALIMEWIECGLAGIEVYYPAHQKDMYEPWLSIARRNKLLVTGGSDFHRTADQDKDHGSIGGISHDWKDIESDIVDLFNAVKQ